MRPSLFIFGLGYVGQYLGHSVLQGGWQVGGTTQTHLQQEVLKSRGFAAVTWGRGASFPDAVLKKATHILITVPPCQGEDGVLNGLKAFASFPDLPLLQWVGYLSSTSVYGDHQGKWVGEASLTRPLSQRGKERLKVERQWLGAIQSPLGLPVHIFRLSGIYGPGRSVLDAIRSGTAKRVDKPGHLFSRIYVKDIVSVLKASMAFPQPGEIYNLADDEPASPADVIAYGCSLLEAEELPPVPFVQASLSPMMKEFYADHKRVSNQKIKAHFKNCLGYPTYREGLNDCLHNSLQGKLQAGP